MDPSPTQFALESPAWLAAVALLPLVWLYFRRNLVGLPAGRRTASLAVRCALLGLLILGLAGPKLRSVSDRIALVVAYDTGRRIGAEAAESAEAFRQDLGRHGGGAVVQELPFSGHSESSPTNLAAALAAARARVPAGRVPRVVLMSDGHLAGGDGQAIVAAVGCPVDVVPLSPPEHEVGVAAVEAPGVVRHGEPFFVDVTVWSLHADTGRLALRVNDSPWEPREVTLTPGENRFRFRQISGSGPWIRLAAQMDGCRDTLPENNRATALVAVRPRPRILLVDPQPELAEALRSALEREGRFHVEAKPAGQLPQRLDTLLEYDLLIASNVPAEKFSERQLESVEQYVRDHGGGLIVVGGDRAFTAGGYGGTRLEAMLPVEAHVRPDKPKPSLAMMLLIDRSGSMQGEPIELARQAARQAVARLSPDDSVGILAFEDRVHWAVPLQPFSDRERIMELIGTVAAGGQSNIYPAMDQAYLALRAASTDLRHMIVISEGTYHPDDYYALVRQIADEGITISTVGVGDEAPKELLRNIAEIASGEAYFCREPEEIARILEWDVMAAGKHGITEEPFRPAVVRPTRMLQDLDLRAAPPLLGYVDSRARPGSQLLLDSPRGDPVLAWWRYGRGGSMAFTSDVHTRWAAAWHRWPAFGDFWTRLAHGAMRADPADRLTVEIVRRGDRAEAALDVVDAEGCWLSSAEVSLRVDRPDDRTEHFVAELVEPGRYAATIPSDVPGEYRVEFTVVMPGESPRSIRRGFTVDDRESLHVRPTHTEVLRQVAEQSGGLFDPTPAEVLRPAETGAPRTLRLWPWLFFAAMVMFVVDVALKRELRRHAEA